MQLKAKHTAILIRNRRKDLKMSQAKLSGFLGWSHKNAQYLSNIERGLSGFPVEYVNKLSCALNVSREIIIEMMTRDYKEQVLEQVSKN